MDATNNVRESIISILRKQNNGLSITEISEKMGMNRRSVTKYIYQLLGEGLLYHRKVGTAKLCYLKVKRGRKKYKR
ncbi:MAG: HTH domain-containing protein [Candidatus Heimdallarchaeaceae archaeon]